MYRNARILSIIPRPKSVEGFARYRHLYASSPSVSFAAQFFDARVRPLVPRLIAPALDASTDSDHVHRVAEYLLQHGMLKVSLQFPDPSSEYLQQLLLNLHNDHGHQLPITHSAKQGFFWDVRPSSTKFQAGSHQARSETLEEFPWHTDCSYEDPPPRYFALHVLQHDRRGGGTLSVMNVQHLSELLPPAVRAALGRPDYKITIPPEFVKDTQRQHIISGLLSTGSAQGSSMIRFREDIVTPLNSGAAHAFSELRRALRQVSLQPHAVLHFTSKDLPKGSIVMIDNRRWLHARDDINDLERHLRRVRWDAVPLPT